MWFVNRHLAIFHSIAVFINTLYIPPYPWLSELPVDKLFSISVPFSLSVHFLCWVLQWHCSDFGKGLAVLCFYLQKKDKEIKFRGGVLHCSNFAKGIAVLCLYLQKKKTGKLNSGGKNLHNTWISSQEMNLM